MEGICLGEVDFEKLVICDFREGFGGRDDVGGIGGG